MYQKPKRRRNNMLDMVMMNAKINERKNKNGNERVAWFSRCFLSHGLRWNGVASSIFIPNRLIQVDSMIHLFLGVGSSVRGYNISKGWKIDDCFRCWFCSPFLLSLLQEFSIISCFDTIFVKPSGWYHCKSHFPMNCCAIQKCIVKHKSIRSFCKSVFVVCSNVFTCILKRTLFILITNQLGIFGVAQSLKFSNFLDITLWSTQISHFEDKMYHHLVSWGNFKQNLYISDNNRFGSVHWIVFLRSWIIHVLLELLQWMVHLTEIDKQKFEFEKKKKSKSHCLQSNERSRYFVHFRCTTFIFGNFIGKWMLDKHFQLLLLLLLLFSIKLISPTSKDQTLKCHKA